MSGQETTAVHEEIRAAIDAMRGRVRRLMVAVCVLAMIIALNTAVMYGTLENYFAGDAMFRGAVAIGSALIGFFFGWFARGRK
jgi:hypothetical protein